MQATDLLRRAVRAVGFGPHDRRAASGDGVLDGRVVALHYTMRLDRGTIVEAFHGHPPFLYLHGAGNIVPGLERAMTGLRVGDRMRVSVPPELGYGPLRPELVKRVPRSEFPPEARLVPGLRFRSMLRDGTILPAWLTEVGRHEVAVSFNHPLADETLHFSVEVLGLRNALMEELTHGHPHGPGGVRH